MELISRVLGEPTSCAIYISGDAKNAPSRSNHRPVWGAEGGEELPQTMTDTPELARTSNEKKKKRKTTTGTACTPAELGTAARAVTLGLPLGIS